MKLGLSQKGDPRGRHLILAVSRPQAYTIHAVIVEEVLRGVETVREQDPQNPDQVRYRFHMNYLDRIMLVFPQVELSPGLDKWFVARQRKHFQDLPVPDISIPGFYDYQTVQPAEPYDFQKVGIGKIEEQIVGLLEADEKRLKNEAEELADMMNGSRLPAFMLNDGMGLGKTIQSLGVAVRNRWFPAIYVGPNSGKWSTKRIIDRFFDDDFTYQVVDGTRPQREAQIRSGVDLTIINYETMRVKREYNRHTREWTYEYGHKDLFFWDEGLERTYEFAIIDEHHRVKTEGAQVTNGFFALKANRWLLMSGTPILNRVEEIWTVLHKIDPTRFPTSYHFLNTYCITQMGSVIGYKPDKILELKSYLAQRSIRRRREHVGVEVPDVVYVRRDVELTAEQKRLYNQIVDELVLEFEDGTKKKIQNPLTKLIRLKQACFSPELYGGSKNSTKISEMRTDIEELVASNEKAIIFSQWSKAARILEREFEKYNPAYVDGSVLGKKRSAQEDKFNNDDSCKLYIGTIGANREAITLSAATYVLFSDKDWTPMANQQAADRSASGGLRGVSLPPGTKVHIIEYYARDTVEEHIEGILARKQAIFNATFEADGGARSPRITLKDVKTLLKKVH